jgi:hypothetical protein
MTKKLTDLDIHTVAKTLGGEVGHCPIGSRRQVNCPALGHGKNGRSMSLAFGPDFPNGYMALSRCGEDAMKYRDFVDATFNLPRFSTPEWREVNNSNLRTPHRTPEPKPVAKTNRSSAAIAETAKKKAVAVYHYIDEHGVLLYQAVRYEPKTFKYRRPNGVSGWAWDLSGVRLVLYNLSAVLEAIANEQPVAAVEGEIGTLFEWIRILRELARARNQMGTEYCRQAVLRALEADGVRLEDPRRKRKTA